MKAKSGQVLAQVLCMVSAAVILLSKILFQTVHAAVVCLLPDLRFKVAGRCSQPAIARAHHAPSTCVNGDGKVSASRRVLPVQKEQAIKGMAYKK